MVRETPAPPRALTEIEIATAGSPIKAKDARPKRGSRHGRSPGPWVAVALSLDPSEARVWHNIPEDEAKAAQSNVTNKRRRDGKDEQGRWRTPCFRRGSLVGAASQFRLPDHQDQSTPMRVGVDTPPRRSRTSHRSRNIDVTSTLRGSPSRQYVTRTVSPGATPLSTL